MYANIFCDAGQVPLSRYLEAENRPSLIDNLVNVMLTHFSVHDGGHPI